MHITDFPRVRDLVERRNKYKEQVGLISEQCRVELLVHVKGGSVAKTDIEGRFAQQMLADILSEIDAELAQLGVRVGKIPSLPV